MSHGRIALALSREDWARICAGLDLHAANEAAAVEELEAMAEAYGEDRGEEIAACRAEQAAAMRVFELVRDQVGLGERESPGGALSRPDALAS